MNKRGDSDTILASNLIYIILFAVFFLGLFMYIVAFQDGTLLWQDFYAKEIGLTVDALGSTSEVTLDVSRAIDIASKHKVAPEQIITIDNVNRLVEVRLDSNSVSRFPFFNDVEIRNARLVGNTFQFTIYSRGNAHA